MAVDDVANRPYPSLANASIQTFKRLLKSASGHPQVALVGRDIGEVAIRDQPIAATDSVRYDTFDQSRPA